MKTAIIYSTLTGNAKKLAEHAGKELAECDIFNINDIAPDSIGKYELLVFCYWCKRGSADPLTIDFSKYVKGKKVITLGTMGAYPRGEYYDAVLSNLSRLYSNDNEYLGGFLCQGAINPVLTERRKSAPKDQHTADENWLKMHLDSRNHPDKKDLQDAAEFIKDIIARL